MSIPTTIPVTVEPEAAARVAELGLQAEFEEMLEQVRQMVSKLRRIEVVLVPPYDTGDDPGIVIQAFRDMADRDEDDPTWNRFSRWKITTFPPDVFRHFNMWILYEGSHAR
jgi:hypothetical protein